MKEKNHDRLQELYLKRLSSSLSDDESFEMLKLLNEKEAVTSLSYFLYEKWKDLDAIPSLEGIRERKIDDLFFQLHTENEVEDDVQLPPPAPRIPFLKTTWFRYAAAIIITLGVGATAYLLTTNKKIEQTLASGNKQLQTDILPGGDKATLTLADGSKIILDNAANGNLANQGGVQVVKLASGQIAYDLKGLATKDAMWNTMSTPRGGQYQVTLPDGTKAWLNAASSITFPTAFIGNERKVKIDGEIYFEVVSDKQKPFVVDIHGESLVQVLGTSFNINSYENEGNIKTSLVEGSVKVIKEDHDVVLRPGYQAVVVSSNRQPNIPGTSIEQAIAVTSANLDQALAWKEGLFNFNDADLKTVMRQLERWYDIKVQYKGAPSNVIFKGKMYRDVNLSFVMSTLKDFGVKLELEGKNLVIF